VVVDWPNQPIWPVVKIPPLHRTKESFTW
jgi:hypothetical protein